MSSAPSYAALLDRLGAAVEQAGGADVLVQELADAFLIAFVTDTEQQVLTLTRTELAPAAARRPRGRWPRLAALRHGQRTAHAAPPLSSGVRARLRAVGHYLDERDAAAIVVHDHTSRCVVEFSVGATEGPEGLRHGTRRSHTLDQGQLLARATATD